jgi:hypothetical protein
VRWASELLADRSRSAAVRQRCAIVSSADVSSAWIPMDLDPTNVLIDDDGRVRFIDVDESFLGPAPLAMALLGQRAGDRSTYRSYEASWTPVMKRLDWRAFETTARVVEAWLGWGRLQRNIARGEVNAARDLVESRIRARLAGGL